MATAEMSYFVVPITGDGFTTPWQPAIAAGLPYVAAIKPKADGSPALNWVLIATDAVTAKKIKTGGGTTALPAADALRASFLPTISTLQTQTGINLSTVATGADLIAILGRAQEPTFDRSVTALK